MRILLVASAFNSLTQRVFAELGDLGHHLAVHLAAGDEALRAAVRDHEPDLLLAPMLKTAIPRDVWSARPCLIVHPGPPGDRGPSSLDWAVHEGAATWGVTVLQANEVMDGGGVWAAASCPLPEEGKSDLYRNEVADAAMRAVLLAVERFADRGYRPQAQSGPDWDAPDHTRPAMRQELRRIDWSHEPTESVLRKLRAADSQPGVRDLLLGEWWFLHGGFPEERLRGQPGELLATRDGAICRATVDGAVWIPQLRRCATGEAPAGFKLPATVALADLGARLPDPAEVPAALDHAEAPRTYRDITYHEDGPVGFLRFRFPGGAMSTDHCRRLLHAYQYACSRPTRAIVLGGARDFFSNGIHLNVIEAAADPAQESWQNINAMDDLVEAVLTTTNRVVIAALAGNAAAGGVMLALAADRVWCRAGVVLNPHYRLMGLYGSEYWTYSLPRRVGRLADLLMDRALPISAACAHRIGLVDKVIRATPADFAHRVAAASRALADSVEADEAIGAKKEARERDEAIKPLQAYRDEELSVMRRIFFDPRAPYHALRSDFVRKIPATATPAHLQEAAGGSATDEG